MLDLPSGRRGLEGQSQAVHAVAKTGGLGAIVEDMAEMAAAAPAVHSRPVHPERSVLRRSDGIVERRPEARPAGTAVEFRRRGEEVESATGAGGCARSVRCGATLLEFRPVSSQSHAKRWAGPPSEDLMPGNSDKNIGPFAFLDLDVFTKKVTGILKKQRPADVQDLLNPGRTKDA